MHALKFANAMLFLSTLSLRRATGNKCCKGSNDSYFYPRSPCGERRQWRRSVKLFRQFLSTLSLRRATQTKQTCREKTSISIHALLAESDGIGLVFMWWGVRFLSTLSLRRATAQTARNTSIAGHFYPRSPCGERQGDNQH